MKEKTLKVSGIKKTYRTQTGSKVVLRKIDLEIRRGQKIAILGRNGSGKSTLIRIIGGIEEPDAGIIIKEMSVSWPIGYNGGTQGSLSGLDNITFLSRVYGADHKMVLDFVADFSELGMALRDPLKTYSAGMRSRFNFALSMAFNFDCFLVDEGLAAGDFKFAEKCERAIKNKADSSLIMVSHSQQAIKDFCDTACVLENGRLVEFSNINDAINYYENT